MTFDQRQREALAEKFAAAPPLPDRVLREFIDSLPETPQTGGPRTRLTTGRSQSMFGATKFLLTGAAIALVGGFLLTGSLVPTAPSGGMSGAETSVTASDAPSLHENEFTGKLAIWGGAASDTPGVIRYNYEGQEMTDPRLEGDWVLDYRQSIVDFGGIRKYLYHASFRMDNEEGAWQEEPNLTLEWADGSASSRTSALVGEGAYEGLTAVAELTYIPQGRFDIHGVIIDGPVPEAPEHTAVAEE